VLAAVVPSAEPVSDPAVPEPAVVSPLLVVIAPPLLLVPAASLVLPLDPRSESAEVPKPPCSVWQPRTSASRPMHTP
jgi:hypothetical protein